MDEHLLRFDKTKTYTFIDYETYNLCLNFCHNKPWQVGILEVKGDRVTGEHDILIKWPNPPRFDPNMVKFIFKCTVDELNARIAKYGVTPEEAFARFHVPLEKSDYIIGHNILGFDVYLLKEFYQMMGLTAEPLYSKIIDTHCLAKGIKMSLPFKRGDNLQEYQYKLLHRIGKNIKTRLGVLGAEYEIEHDYENLHDAITDLKLNKKVWEKLRNFVDI